jgi:hypothetical protein
MWKIGGLSWRVDKSRKVKRARMMLVLVLVLFLGLGARENILPRAW